MFDEQAETSLIKSEIFTRYFLTWAKNLIRAQKRYRTTNRIAYVDLFAGPGFDRDGVSTTPLTILHRALADPELAERLVPVFFDRSEANTRSLEAAIAALPGVERLRHPPSVFGGEVGAELSGLLAARRLVPTLLLVEPFGVEASVSELIHSILQGWGCDGMLFFTSGRRAGGIHSPMHHERLVELLGAPRAAALDARLQAADARDERRAAIVVEEMKQALEGMGGRFVLPFRYRHREGAAGTHDLLFVSKNFRGYAIMREVLAEQRSAEPGATAFEYLPAEPDCPALYELLRPVEELEGLLLTDCAGERWKFAELFEHHSVGRPFVEKDYRDVVLRLEAERRVTIDPPCPPRRRGAIARATIVFPKPRA
ncbi:MAG: three-Cys-motif partner protein TcmP [Pirellulales bacterium]|nr:three-Cys-motif partner protein TcmP [Pirellulales bacterium]